MIRFFLKIYDFLAARQWCLWLAMVASVALLTLGALQLKLKTDISEFVPQNDNGELRDVINDLEIKDRLIVMVSARDSVADTDVLIEAAEAFETTLWQHTDSAHLRSILAQMDENQLFDTFDFIYEHLPLFLTDEDYAAFEREFSQEKCDSVVAEIYQQVLSPAGFAMQDFLLRDPFGFGNEALAKLQSLNQFKGYALYDGYLFSQDLSTLFMFIDSQDGSNASAKNDELITAIDAAFEQISTQYQVEMRYYGATAIAVYNARTIKRDLLLTLSMTLLLVLLVVYLAFRRKRALLLLALPVAFGMLFALACMWVIQGSVSAIAVGTGSIVLGVALSYVIHVLSHANHSQNARQVITELAKPLTIGSITTIGAFAGLLFTSSPLLHDFGLFASCSLVGTILCSLIFLPHFLVFEGKSNSRFEHFVGRVNAYPYDKNRWVVGILAMVVAITAFFCNDVQFDYNVMHLNYVPPHIVQAENTLQSVGFDDSASLLVSATSDSMSAMQNYAETKSLLDEAQKQGVVTRYASAADFVMSAEKQQERIAAWNAFWTEENKRKCVRGLSKSAEKQGFTSTAFAPFYAILNKTYAPTDLVSEILEQNLAFANFINKKNDKVLLLSQVWLDNEQKADIYAKTKAFVVDQSYFISAYAKQLNDDFNYILWMSSLLIFVVLLATYRRLELALMAFLPMGVSWIAIVGLMAIFGIKFNIVNIILSTFIFGIGDDYSIFVLDGLQSEYRNGRKMLTVHKTAIFFSVLMTLAGMGALIFAKHPAIHSLATISLLGIAIVTIVAYVLLPLIFRFLTHIRTAHNWPLTLRDLGRTIVPFSLFFLCNLVMLALLPMVLLLPLPLRRKRWLLTGMMHLTGVVALWRVPGVRIDVLGEKIDFKTPRLIIANHNSFLDLLYIWRLVPHAEVVCKKKVWNSPLFGMIVRCAGFIRAENGSEQIAHHVRERMNEGFSVVVFPEGTRSYDEQRMQRFHKGVFLLAEQLHLDLLPVVLWGSGTLLSHSQEFYVKPGRVALSVMRSIAHDDTRFGLTYQERAKNMRLHMMTEHERLNTLYRVFDNDFYPTATEHLFVYKGADIEHVTKKRIRHRETKFLADNLPTEGTIVEYGCNYGERLFLLAMLAPKRLLRGIEYDPEKVETANHCVFAENVKCVLYQDFNENLTDAAAVVINENNAEKLQMIMDDLSQKGCHAPIYVCSTIAKTDLQKIVGQSKLTNITTL